MFRDTVASLDLKVPIDVVELTIHRVYQVLNDRTGMRYRKQCLQDLPTRLSQLPRGARATFLDVRSIPYYLGAWNRLYLILQNVLCDRIYNTRHKS